MSIRSIGKGPHEPELIASPNRYAVLLNAQAKRWTGELHEDVLRYVPRRDLHLTDDFHQAERTVDKLLADDYDVIFTGGGDGTVVYLVNAIERRIASGKLERDKAPDVGILRMGTGNALATYVDCKDILEDLRALRSGASLRRYPIHMLEGAAGLFPFAGFGWDADILTDYESLKDAVHDTALENYATGLGGYAASIALKTIPKAISQSRAKMVMRNLGDVAYKIEYDGTVIDELGPGDIMYEGSFRICSAASIPYWGFKIRMFPHADAIPGMFQVRAFDGPVREVLTNLRSFWRGEMREEFMVDYIASHIEVEMPDGPIPYQVAGDAAGMEKRIEWKTFDHASKLASVAHPDDK